MFILIAIRRACPSVLPSQKKTAMGCLYVQSLRDLQHFPFIVGTAGTAGSMGPHEFTALAADNQAGQRDFPALGFSFIPAGFGMFTLWADRHTGSPPYSSQDIETRIVIRLASAVFLILCHLNQLRQFSYTIISLIRCQGEQPRRADFSAFFVNRFYPIPVPAEQAPTAQMPLSIQQNTVPRNNSFQSRAALTAINLYLPTR
jgi:hypothetical protein